MDRWSGRDGRDDGDNAAAQRPAGQVARSGLGAFVKADTGMGTSETTQHRPATVTLSRREQAQAQQAATTAGRITASVAAASPAAPPAGPPGPKLPPWAVDPPPVLLQATKDAVVVQTLPLQHKRTLFGRLATADVQLEHASISRQHALLCFRPNGTAVLMDLDSAHGTFVGSERLAKYVPRDIAEGEDMRFGASTRQYTLKRRHGSSSGDRGRKRSVSWPDETDAAGPDKKRRSSSNGLEQVVGFSDGKSFAVNVGPVAAAPQQSEGRFAGMVSQVVRPSPAKPAAAGDGQEAAPPPDAPQPPPADVSHAAKVKRLAQEEFRKFVEQRGRKSSSFYDELPPPASGS